jgi:hypothetical protein
MAAIGSSLSPSIAEATLIAQAINVPASTYHPATKIENQATVIYQDPSSPNKPLTAVSETITIDIQEIAGVTIKAINITRQDGGNIVDATTGNILFFNFEVQNVGGDTTKFFIPDQATVGSIGTLQKLQYFDGTTWIDVPSSGYISNVIGVNGRLPLRVLVSVKDPVGTLTVSLGNTPNDGQNQAQIVQPGDVYTVDASDNTSGEMIGTPANGVREAQATQSLKIGYLPEALARIDLKIDRPFDPYTNTISFGMNLQVLAALPPNFTNITPTDLTGLSINLDGRPQTGILVADAIPLGTEFRSATAPTAEWIPIYEYGDPIGANERADLVNWSTTKPDASTIAKVKRVGFFRSNFRMAKGTSIDGFKVQVEVVDRTITKIYNIAQAFGTVPANPNSSNDLAPSSRAVYDESGDEQPNNYSYDGKPFATGPNGQPIVNPGLVDPAVVAADPRSPIFIGEAKGTASFGSADGEYIVIPLQLAAPPALKNGPRQNPKAIGPSNDNDDFTNKSTSIGGDAAFDPAPLAFTNTVINTSDLTREIKVVPTVDQVTDLPEGAIITLSDPTNPARTATFKYTKGAFVPELNSPSTLVLVGIIAGATKDYSVLIDLPKDTPVTKAFPLKLVAFIDRNNNNLPDVTEAQNATIDRLYTGFMQVVKESRVLALVDSNLQPVIGEDGKFSQTAKSAQLDQFIEYRIIYTNISTPTPTNGSGNRTLSATNFGITEDGTVLPNNWASLTQNDPNSASSTTGTITYSNAQGLSTSTDPAVSKYEVILTNPVNPSEFGTFIFRRKVK